MSRSLRRMIGAALLTMGASASVHAGCGIDVLGTAPHDGGMDVVVVEAAPMPLDDGGDFDGDATQGGCSPLAGQTICGTKCTDTMADPENCGACGKACQPGETCEVGKCEILCLGDQLRCNGACVVPKSDSAHCGSCTKACLAGEVCLDAVCKTDCGSLSRCMASAAGGDASAPDYCADLTKDRNNCGVCGTKCAVNEICSASACVPVCTNGTRIGDEFGGTMFGCVARVIYEDRAGICPAGLATCSAAQYVARRAGKKPAFNYWTNDYLQWTGSDGFCAAVGSGNPCYGTPMRVCGAKTDPVGNQCNYTNCGLGTRQPNEYFGGCQNNDYAGVLCCKP